MKTIKLAQCSVRLPLELQKQFKALCALEDLSITDKVTDLVKEWVKKNSGRFTDAKASRTPIGKGA